MHNLVIRPNRHFSHYYAQNDGQIEVFVDGLKKNIRLTEPIKSKAEMKVYEPEYPMVY